MIRQKIYTTLHERFFIVPYLSEEEKKYIISQAILGLYQVHNNNLFHGSLNPSNILLTTSNHVFISDFAPYKPNFLSEDIYLEYSLFYESQDHKCYLAPEKFIKGYSQESQNVVDIQQLSQDQIHQL